MYTKALEYTLPKSREEGIDAAMKHEGGKLDGLLVPLLAEGGVGCAVAAKGGYPMITIPVGVNDTDVPFGIGIMQMAWNENLWVKSGSATEDLVHHLHRPTSILTLIISHTLVLKPAKEGRKLAKRIVF